MITSAGGWTLGWFVEYGMTVHERDTDDEMIEWDGMTHDEIIESYRIAELESRDEDRAGMGSARDHALVVRGTTDNGTMSVRRAVEDNVWEDVAGYIEQ